MSQNENTRVVAVGDNFVGSNPTPRINFANPADAGGYLANLQESRIFQEHIDYFRSPRLEPGPALNRSQGPGLPPTDIPISGLVWLERARAS